MSCFKPTRLPRLALVLSLTFASISSWALPPELEVHQYVETNWGLAEGLPQTTGQTLLQASDGMLWIGTQDGLARFDGMDFQVYAKRDHPGLAHPHINDLAEDNKGQIWIATDQGLSVYHRGSIDEIKLAERPTGPVHALAYDRERDAIWIAAETGLYRATVDHGMEAIEAIREPLFSLVLDDAGRLLLGSRGTIFEWHEEAHQRHELGSGHEDLEILSLMIQGDTLWQGSSRGLRTTPLSNPTDTRETLLPEREVEALLRDNAGSLWVITESGLFRMRPDEQTPRRARTQHLSANEWVRDVIQDDEGNIWLGSHGRGISRLRAASFTRFTAKDGLTDDLVWTLYEAPNGSIWVGSNEEGAFRMQDGRFSQPIELEDLPHAMTMGFLHDQSGHLWIATRGGIAVFDGDTLEPLDTPEGLPQAAVFGITDDADGRVWMASRDGLYYWHDEEGAGRISEAEGLTQERTRDVLVDQHGMVWVASDTGVFRGGVDGVEAVGLAEGLDDYTATALFEFGTEIWVALQGGIARIQGEQVSIYRDEHGLNASIGSFLVRDEQDHIWSTTHEGIERIPMQQFDELDAGERDFLTPTVYGHLEDQVRAQCNGGHGQAGLYQPASGHLWCPTLEGVLRLDMATTEQQPPAPQPRILRVRAGDETFELYDADDASLTLPPHVRDLEIDYVGRHFRFPGGVNYRFRLSGFDDSWSDPQGRRTAFYTNLPAGDYEFQLHARNERNIESEEPAVLRIELTPRFHETGLFRGAMAGLIFLLAYGAWRISVRRLHQRRIALERVVRKRTRQLQELNRQLRQASLTDPLTGLHNRRYLSDQLPHDIAQVDRAYTREDKFPNRDITFLMIDLDHFKRINDDWGHQAGDDILAQFAAILNQQVRDSDYVVRWGGEEFLVVARNSERRQSTACAKRIMDAVRSHCFTTEHGEVDCSCSIGLSSYPARIDHPDQLNWEEVIELADAANYMAKAEGRDRWVEIAVGQAARSEGFMAAFREDADSMERNEEIQVVRERNPS